MEESTRTLTESAADLANRAKELSDKAANLAIETSELISQQGDIHAAPFVISGLTVFILACFVGYHVVWRVTPALHSPLMGITNAISSVIIVGAIMAASPVVTDTIVAMPADAKGTGFSQFLGFLAIVLASVNIFGGFIITRRMLSMFKKKGA
ncbi:MAG: NAD synthetase [Micavibrio sp.]|nr:NAD synthetase [Micavibrio sp.]|tara:strand:+ start:4360 stop:4818 length:459 start_codon:yes stop_codon:yes gene_type:complete